MFRLFISIFIITCAGFVLEAQQSYPLTIRPEMDYISQGFGEFKGFESVTVKTDPPALFFKIGKGVDASFRSCLDYLISGETGLVKIELKIKANGLSGAEAKPVMRIKWTWGGADLPLYNDGLYHTYTFDLTAQNSWKAEKGKRSKLAIFPCLSNGIESAEVEIARIEAVLTPEAEYSRYCKLTEERLFAQEALLQSLKKSNIPYGDSDEKLSALRLELNKLKKADSSQISESLKSFKDLNDRFKETYEKLSVCRRLKELYGELEAMRQTAPGSVEKASMEKITGKIHETLKEGNFAVAASLEDVGEEELIKLWNSILKTEPMQAGLDLESFSRFGWVQRATALLVNNEKRDAAVHDTFKFYNEAHPTLSFKPYDAVFMDDAGSMEKLNWVCKTWLWTCKKNDGSIAKWKRTTSLLAPGSLLETDLESLDLSTNAKTPSGIIGVFEGKVIFLSAKDFASTDWKKLSENWLILLAGDAMPETPWLLTLQKRPDSISISEKSIRLLIKGGIGIVGFSSPYGIKVLPQDFASKCKTAPEEVLNLARSVNSLMTHYPSACREFFKIDERAGRVEIENRFEYIPISNEWGFKGEPRAILPPMTVFASEHGYPVSFEREPQKTGLMTRYGAYATVPGNTLRYFIQVPDLREDVLLDTPFYPERKEKLNEAVNTFFFAKPQGFDPSQLEHSANAPYFEAWNMMSAQNRENLGKNVRLHLKLISDAQARLGTLDGSFRHHALVERTEPFSGKNYLAYGWRSERFGKEVFGDVTNFVGFMSASSARFFSLSGSWEENRHSWKSLRRLFTVCQRRSDWAMMGQDCMEYGASHLIDMAPDCWIAAANYAKMGRGFGDRRIRDLGLYMAAKESIPLVMAFYKRDFDMNYVNTWDWERQVPESGWSDEGNVCGATWENASIIYNFLSGCVYSKEEYVLYRKHASKQAQEFVCGWLEKYYPQWRDVTYRLKGKNLSENVPATISQIFMLREVLGDSNDSLEGIMVDGLAEKLDKPLWAYVSCPSLPCLSVAAPAVLIGRDAPCSVGEFFPASLGSGSFDPLTKTAKIRFKSKQAFVAEIISEKSPSSVTLNGKILKSGEYSFESEKRSLKIQVDKSGEAELILEYSAWQRPVRTALKKIEPEINLTPEMKLCLAAKDKSLIKDEDFQISGKITPLDLTEFLNMSLLSGPADGNPCFGQVAPQILPKSGLSNLPRGLQDFRGATFKIQNGDGRAAIGLGGHKTKAFPEKVTGIKVGRKFKSLYFMHAASYDPKNGDEIIRYVINCNGGKQFTVSVNSCAQIGDWWTPSILPDAKLVKTESGDHQVGLYVMKWNNHFDRSVTGVIAEEQLDYYVIESIDIYSTGKAGACAVLAISGEER